MEFAEELLPKRNLVREASIASGYIRNSGTTCARLLDYRYQTMPLA